MTPPSPSFLFILVLALAFTAAPSAPILAQQSTAPPQSPPQAESSVQSPPAAEDDDAVLRPLEPDFTLINLPTTLPLPLHKSNFRLTHRFNGNLRLGDFDAQASSLFGTDEGATIGFEYRFAIAKHVELAAYRTNFNRTIQIYGKYDAFHQGASTPLGFSAPQVVAMATTKEDVVFIFHLKLEEGKLLALPGLGPVNDLVPGKYRAFRVLAARQVAIGIQRENLTKTAFPRGAMHLFGIEGAIIDDGHLDPLGYGHFPEHGSR